MLRVVIHDWDDDDAIRILTVVRQAIQANGTLLLVERVIAPPNQGREAKFSDLNMRGIRSAAEPSGFRLARVVGAGDYSVVEGAPA